MIMSEVQRFDQNQPLQNEVSHDIHWLRHGQAFEL
jgi:hypothetical protein